MQERESMQRDNATMCQKLSHADTFSVVGSTFIGGALTNHGDEITLDTTQAEMRTTIDSQLRRPVYFGVGYAAHELRASVGKCVLCLLEYRRKHWR